MKKEDIVQVFAKYSETAEKIAKLKAELSALEKDQEMATMTLSSLIPEGESKAGIQHKLVPHTSVSYAKALKDIREQLIPKTKQDQVDALLKEYTNCTFSHKFVSSSN